uniref:NADH-ubiquinone oxidoreductase chain 3 n=1 Tax=Ischnobaenella hainana TaxID=1347743 RepID=A0A7I6HL50_9HEMI|nr:NADH dehydrogenase subunit 3 [Ischnobaenella hainana]
MMKIMTTIIMTIIISMILIMMCGVISKKSILDREKMSPFECGFDPKSSSRMPFSIQFFLIAILFLIFDIEIILILPMIEMIKISMIKMWIITITLFSMILITGLIYEWKLGVLNWN